MLTLIARTRKWHTYCPAAAKLYLITDHNPLKWLRKQKNPLEKYTRWIVELEALPYETISRNGLDHIVPDCMSRRPDSSREEEIQNDEPYLENHIFALKVEPTNEE